MSRKRDLLISLLKLTQHTPIHKSLVVKDARIPSPVAIRFLKQMSKEHIIQSHSDGMIEASPSQRVVMAVYAIKLGADFEQVSKFLLWPEFERMAAHTFEANDLMVIQNFRFKHLNKRWEIDVLGFKDPLIVCLDCKHWQHGWSQAAIKKTVDLQIKRTKTLAEALPHYYHDFKLDGWKSTILLPVILSLTPGPLKFYRKVPVVPVLKLQNFINELPAHATSLTHFKQNKLKIYSNLIDFTK